MHIWISGFTAVFGITHMRWLHHQSILGGDTYNLRLPVSRFRRKLSVKFRHHQTSYLSHVWSAVNMRSQFHIYFTSRKTELNITNTTGSKLTGDFQKIRFIGKCPVNIHRAQLVQSWESLIQFSSTYFAYPPSPNCNYEQHIHCTYNVEFRRVCVANCNVEKYYIFWACVCSPMYKAYQPHAQYHKVIFGLSGFNIFFHIIS
jgi:hypothetical protein